MLSYAPGGRETPLTGHTIGEDLERAARDFGDRDALVSCAQDLRYTYAELDAAVDQVARGLLQAGVEKGDRGAIWARTARSGCSSSTRPRRSARSSSTSTPP